MLKPEIIAQKLHLPLKNIEYTLQEYLLSNGVRMDVETRFLLARVRDCVAQMARETAGGTAPQALAPRRASWYQDSERMD